ncbi:restriction endonuclease subunit S [Cupriavidus taiwanensis]|uniref:Restriction modification system DNA specificity domain-containing protein n=1 Tax=Cupriavidus taiwanensis TaxID=164546 RepID=A0A7Z7NR23_9BURK|nr:restriction endonuclease subunit S [Cupriavidus taiwanensis]SOZ17272.1 Restriction modification system DNA specificity domain-containing protein [Cupriavidus taiwanensis]SOZ96400.1 Restriction modification system DNA specificity domain-containing protein [Cupriavidus taiwanensis]SPC25654.1 Restriction modification system DNA specificity domain-containing protein [Cupriavidus taiwanensis]
MKLMEGFNLLATAPDGVTRLRELILRFAVQGRLAAQNSSDEPAGELVRRITSARSTATRILIESGRALDKVLPLGWCEVPLGLLFTLEYGSTLPQHSRIAGEIPVYGSNGVVGHHNLALIESPSIIIGRKGSVGAVNVSEGPFWPIDTTYYVTPPDGMDLRFTYLLFKSLDLGKHDKSTAIPGINRKDVYQENVAVPPTVEQKRIVAKFDELMRLCDALEANDRLEAEQHARLTATLFDALTASESAHALAENWSRIATHFDLLLDRPEAVDALEQTILQLAVRGLLVPQDDGDEPTSLLLTRLRKDRREWLESKAENDPECRTALKKLKGLAEPDVPFKIPSTWEFVHLIDCSRLLVDCHNKTAPYAASGIPIIRTTNIRNGRFRFDDLRYVTQETYEFWSRRCPPAPGDIIFTREAPMGEAAVIPEDAVFCLGQRTMLVRPMHDYINVNYLLLALTEPHLLERAAPAAIGSTVKHLRVGDVEQLSIPLPPYAEQERIVKRVQELRQLCSDLRTRLTERQTCQVHFAAALVEQTAAGPDEDRLELAA